MNTIAINYAACIKQEAHWGYDKWHNICTGTWSSVNWGAMDWTHAVGGMILFAGLLAVPVTILIGMIQADRAQQKMLEKWL